MAMSYNNFQYCRRWVVCSFLAEGLASETCSQPRHMYVITPLESAQTTRPTFSVLPPTNLPDVILSQTFNPQAYIRILLFSLLQPMKFAALRFRRWVRLVQS
jgi:hypothetical protein